MFLPRSSSAILQVSCRPIYSFPWDLPVQFCHPTLHTFSSSSSNRSALRVWLLYPVLRPPTTLIADILMCLLSLPVLSLPVNGYMPKKNVAASNRSCNIPHVLHAAHAVESLRRHNYWHFFLPSSNNLCVRFRIGNFRQNTKSTYGREGFTSHSTRTWLLKTVVCASSRVHGMLVHGTHVEYTATCCCIATQSANHTDYLIFKLYVYYFLENALMRRLL